MKRITEILNLAKENVLKYPTLNSFLDWDKIQNFLIKDMSKLNREKNIPFNVLEALIAVGENNFSAYDTSSNLLNLEVSLNKILPLLSQTDIKEIKIKLSNLGNSSFWDTATELWFASELKGKNYNLKFDFPLRKHKKGFTPPNADIAIVDSNNEPIWLFDCVNSTLEDSKCKDLILTEGEFIEEPEMAIDCSAKMIKKKFNEKFLPNINFYPNASYGIFVGLTKADDITAHLHNLNFLRKTPVKFDVIKYKFHPKLKYAIVGRFQENNNQIEFVSLLIHKV